MTGKASIGDLHDVLRTMPLRDALDAIFGPGKAVYDAEADVWIVANPRHAGPGFGFIAVRPDGSWFAGVVPVRHAQ